MGLAERGAWWRGPRLLPAEAGVAQDAVGDRERCLRARRAQRARIRDERCAGCLRLRSRLLGECCAGCARVSERWAGGERRDSDARDDCIDPLHGSSVGWVAYWWWAGL